MAAKRLKVEEIGDVSVIFFLDKRILEDSTIQAIAGQLYGLVEDSGRRKLLLNFNGVEYMSSAALGKLINLHKTLTDLDGTMAICNVVPQILEVFSVTKLDKIFGVFPDQDAAMARLN